MTYATLQSEAQDRHLTILGGFHPAPEDNAPPGCRTLLLLGPDEPGFWPAFQDSAEARDGSPDPMDRWSSRVIGGWAKGLGAKPLFPFGGPPYQPFYSWALRTGRCHASPVHLLIHDTAGLFVSFRGALALEQEIALPKAPSRPCDSCAAQPCATACPSQALTPAQYDVPVCRAHLATPEGQTNLENGCAVRRACPVSQRFGRLPAQSAYHMAQFAGGTM